MSVRKDEVQAVIPIAKHKELMNLAVLTGRQVSRPLKVFIVSEGGDVADVTLHSSCTSRDQSVLKVIKINGNTLILVFSYDWGYICLQMFVIEGAFELW